MACGLGTWYPEPGGSWAERSPWLWKLGGLRLLEGGLAKTRVVGGHVSLGVAIARAERDRAVSGDC